MACFYLMQAMYFCYGIGALISPLIAKDFLVNEDCSILVTQSLQQSSNSTSLTMSQEDKAAQDSLEAAHQHTRVYQAFWLIAAIQVNHG